MTEYIQCLMMTAEVDAAFSYCDAQVENTPEIRIDKPEFAHISLLFLEQELGGNLQRTFFVVPAEKGESTREFRLKGRKKHILSSHPILRSLLETLILVDGFTFREGLEFWR